MKAWLATDVVGLGAGLGKMDIVVIPRGNGNSLAVKVTRDGRVWVGGEMKGQPTPENELQEIEIEDILANAVNISFDSRDENLSQCAKDQLTKLVKCAL